MSVAYYREHTMLDNLLTLVIVLCPMLNTYRSIIPSVELGTFLLLFFFVLKAIQSRKLLFRTDSLKKGWIITLLVITLCSSLSVLAKSMNYVSLATSVFRFLKVSLAVIIVVLFGDMYINKEYAIKVLRSASLLCVGFMIVQLVAFRFGRIIRGVYTPFAFSEGYVNTNIEYMSTILFRPSGFFYEPAHFCAYSLVYISYLLCEKGERYRIQKLIIMSLSIVFSTSATGIIVLLVIISAYAILNVKGIASLNIKSVMAGLALTVGFIVFAFFYLRSELGHNVVARYINEDGTFTRAVTGRLDSGAGTYFQNLTALEKTIGTGFGNRPTDVYFSSLYAILYGDGILGLLLVLRILFISFIKTDNFGKVLCIAYCALMIGTGVFNFASIALYFYFIHADMLTKRADRIM